MTLTTDILCELERESHGAPATMLERCIRRIRAGMAQSHPDVMAHADVLVLKLEHLIRCQRAEATKAGGAQEHLAPWITLAEPLPAVA